MKNRILFFITIIVSLIILTAMAFPKDKYMSEDGVKIVVYKEGKEIFIDPNTPHFKELQEKCERYLSSADSVLKSWVKEKDVSRIKREEFAIEITYKEPREIEIIFFNRNKFRADHLMIPLVDHYRMTGQICTRVFFYGPGYSVDYLGPHSSPNSTREIIELLQLMGVI